jgi:hypothetical protein
VEVHQALGTLKAMLWVQYEKMMGFYIDYILVFSQYRLGKARR